MYLAGFGNHHQTEAVTGALPKQQNSPQQCSLGLFAEQLSGSAFTRERQYNLSSWLYRKTPSVVRQEYALYDKGRPAKYLSPQAPNPFRWSPLETPTDQLDFIDGLSLVATANLVSAYRYQCTQSMVDRYFINHDGEFLLVPYVGEIVLFTEFGKLVIKPGQIAVIPRGVTFKVELESALACGYLAENAGLPLRLPELGVIGANGLANPRHFLYPTAAFEEITHEVTLICKSQQHLWAAQSPVSPLNVLAWHGNYAPFCYDLSLFNTINSVSFDHPDPSIFTVLTSDSAVPGVANLDFVIFPPRWMVAEHTFRPPYFHKNVMSELMGLITGEYDAKQEGFSPGGISIHNVMTPHGPDTDTYQQMIKATLQPTKYEDTMAFMFETSAPWILSEAAFHHPSRQKDYLTCWQGLAP